MKSLLTLLLFVTLLSPRAAEPGVDLFATNAPVPRLQIEIGKNNYRSLQHEPRKAVPCTVREGEAVYTNVMVHLKGAAGSFRNINDNPGLTLSFGKDDSPQRFHGLRKIHLNNSIQDPSFTTHNICSQIFRDAGIPAARVANARVSLNGRDLGFYVLAEGYTKDFLKLHFKDTKGNLYDGGFLQDITGDIEQDAGEKTDRADIKALIAAAHTSDRAQRWQALQKILDVDRFAAYMALEIIMWDWDGYPMKHNNYRIYNDPSTGKLVFIPHGMDQMFWDTQGSIYNPPIESLLGRAFLQTTEGSQLYRQSLHKVFTNAFRLEVVTNRLDQLAKRNRAAAADMGRGMLNHLDGQTAETRRRIVARWENVKQQLENEPQPLDFSKPVALKNWRQQTEMGGATLDKPTVENIPTLRIAANGATTASWRSTVSLEPGRYRFHASARSAKLAAMSDSKGVGGGIRISGAMQARRNRIEGDAPWSKLQYDFDVLGGLNTVTLICELRANRGEVWFDLNSLTLEKIR